jgi:Tol biopolymer transport system component
MRADGSGLRRVTAAKVAAGRSAWSPDGKRLVFDTLSRSGGLYVIRVGGGKARKLVACGLCSFPSWSPDGRRIAFDRYILPTVSDEIDVVNANCRRLRTIGRVPGGVTGLDWSPSGHELAFATLGTPQKPGVALKVVGSNGQGLRTVAAGANGGVSWSPDGTLIAFVRGAAIDVVSVDGKSERTLTSLRDPFGELIAWQPVGNTEVEWIRRSRRSPAVGRSGRASVRERR